MEIGSNKFSEWRFPELLIREKTPRNGTYPEWKIPRNKKIENIAPKYVIIDVISFNGVDKCFSTAVSRHICFPWAPSKCAAKFFP